MLKKTISLAVSVCMLVLCTAVMPVMAAGAPTAEGVTWGAPIEMIDVSEGNTAWSDAGFSYAEGLGWGFCGAATSGPKKIPLTNQPGNADEYYYLEYDVNVKGNSNSTVIQLQTELTNKRRSFIFKGTGMSCTPLWLNADGAGFDAQGNPVNSTSQAQSAGNYTSVTVGLLVNNSTKVIDFYVEGVKRGSYDYANPPSGVTNAYSDNDLHYKATYLYFVGKNDADYIYLSGARYYPVLTVGVGGAPKLAGVNWNPPVEAADFSKDSTDFTGTALTYADGLGWGFSGVGTYSGVSLLKSSAVTAPYYYMEYELNFSLYGSKSPLLQLQDFSKGGSVRRTFRFEKSGSSIACKPGWKNGGVGFDQNGEPVASSPVSKGIGNTTKAFVGILINNYAKTVEFYVNREKVGVYNYNNPYGTDLSGSVSDTNVSHSQTQLFYDGNDSRDYAYVSGARYYIPSFPVFQTEFYAGEQAIDSLQEGTVNAVVTSVNYSENPISFAYLLALYEKESGRLIQVTMKTGTISGETSVPVPTNGISVSDPNNQILKLYLLDGTETLKPFQAPVVLS